MKMKRALIISLAVIFCSCGTVDKKAYKPTHFPNSEKAQGYKIPFSNLNNDILVKIRLNGGTQFPNAKWDSGCSLPLKISYLEINNLLKDNTFKESCHISDAVPVTVANGQTVRMDAYILDKVSFTDINGDEHTVNNVLAVIDPNMSTSILIGKPLMDALGYSQEIDNIESVIYIRE